jgi:hypothetical protein
MTGGEDQIVRFFELGTDHAQPHHEYAAHAHQIKSVDHNQKDLYLSVDNYLIVVCQLSRKQILRTLHQDMFLPQKTLFRSA